MKLIQFSIGQAPGIKNAELTVYDLIGRQVLHRQMPLPLLHLDLSSLSSGVYLLQVKSDDRPLSGKFVKQ